MARLDLGGLRDLWYRIDDIFARRTEAAHSLSLSNSLLVLKSVSGTTLATVSLSGLMQTSTANNRFGHALRLSGKRLSLINYAGTEISHVTLP